MKILLAGNANSFWIKSYIENVLIRMGDIEIYLLSFESCSVENYRFYESKNVNVFNCKDKPLKKVHKMVSWCNKISRKGKFDYMHIHYIPSNSLLYIYWYIYRRYVDELIVTYYGSDLFTTNYKVKTQQKLLLNNAIKITLATKNMIDTFNLNYDNKYNDKIIKIAFGINTLDYIDDYLKQDDIVKVCKRLYKISENKRSIAIGYNGRETQNHLKILEEIGKLPKKFLNESSLILQLNYNLTSQEYKDRIISKLNDIDVEYVIIDNYLGVKEMSKLKLATDIIIHGQNSDAFSASIQESIYAGSMLINANWIKYNELNEKDCKYYTFNNFEEIPEILLNNKVSKKEKEINRKIIRELSSWESNIEKWWSLYLY